MVNLDKKIFGDITFKEVIGAEPPIEVIQPLLEKQLDTLIQNLETMDSDTLQKLLESQKEAEKEVDSRPGAMALAQNKIKLFTEFNQKLVQEISKKVES